MLEQLAAARRVVEDGDEMVPAWRIATAQGNFLICTRFDTDKDEQRERTLFLISRFMVWKMAPASYSRRRRGSAPRRRVPVMRLAVGV